jgi:hypothetical protein
MSELAKIRSKIAITETELADAQRADDEIEIKELIEQQRQENLLLASQGKL